MARKYRPPGLDSVNAPRWLSVTDVWGESIEVRTLPPGADLKGIIVTALAAYVAEGWKLEDFSSQITHAFINRGNERYMVAIRPTDPGKPLAFNQVSIEGTVKR